MREKLKAAGIHFLMSLVLISFLFCLIYFIWYPKPFYELSGGRRLIELIFGVDLVLGPILTLVAFNKKKSFRHNFMDISVIACIQLAALAYGVHAVFQARPVFLVFEYYRFNLVHANDIDSNELRKNEAVAHNGLPLWGPGLLGLKKPENADAQFDSLTLAVSGVPEAAQPALWIPYSQVQSKMLAKAKPVNDLLKRFPERSGEIQSFLRESNIVLDQAIYFPAILKKSYWTVIFDKSHLDRPFYLEIDSFE